MKANLQAAEPQALARWDDIACTTVSAKRGPGAQVRPARRPAVRERTDSPRNGAQQDSQGLRRQVADDGGVDAPYVPGYDCHGLPIELKVDRELGPKKREMSVADFRRACRAYAERFIGVMTEEFKRLGIFGDWDHPYLTMNFSYQATIARALGSSSSRGWSTRARSPSTGASIAEPRWPRRKSSTRTTRRRRSMLSSRCAG